MIEVNNLTHSRIEAKSLIKIAQTILEAEAGKNWDLSIVLVGLRKMRELNRQYRLKDAVTDVLAFEGLATFKQPKGKKALSGDLGELVICPQVVKGNAKRFRLTPKKELGRVLIHGILHLLGYNHKKSRPAARKMKEKENCYLLKFQ